MFGIGVVRKEPAGGVGGADALGGGQMMRGFVGLTLVMLLAGGCAARVEEVMQTEAAGGGTRRTYAVTPEQAWSMAQTVLRREGFYAIEEHRAEGYLLATSPVTFWSGGTLAGLWIAPVEADESAVTVVTRRRRNPALVGGLTEDDFHRRLKEAVAATKAGKPIR